MPILPIDLQALLVRMGSVSKMQQMQQEGIVIAQSTVKAQQMGEKAQRESSQVNPLRPHPDENSRVDDKAEGSSGGKARAEVKKRKKSDQRKSRGKDDFSEPYKGTVIDTSR
ncbi:MAG: hypothetical protein ACOC7U_02615 [Spirochaetota bacterium]